MSGGGKSSTSTSSVSIPPEVLARYNAVNTRAENVAEQGFTPYGGQFVAPLTETQQAGISNISQTAGAAQPYYQAATTSLLGGASQAQPYYQGATEALSGGQAAAAPLQAAAAQNISGAQAAGQPYQGMATGFGLAGARQIAPGGLNVGAYMSPYTEAVAQPTYQALRQQQQQEQQKIVGDQIRSGAFGGDRGRIAQAVLAQQQNLATGQAMGNIYQQGYGQALGAAQQQQGVALQTEQSNRQAQQQAANQFLGIGQQAFGQGSQTAQQQAALAQQQFGQGVQSAQTQQALGQGVYGMGAGVSQGLAGIGTGAQQAGLQGGQAQLAAGTVEQQTQQANNQAQYNQFLQQQGYPFQVAQFLANIAMGTGALSGSTTTTQQPSSVFSDERLKEDVEPIGKTFDGQKIVRFKYKGEPGTRIGLVAQDVEKKHPEAVGLAGGYKTVDYDAATDEAAARAPKAYGGGLSPWDGSSMGGSVFREDAGAGFAAGGAPGGDDVLAQINALVNSHQGMYPYGKAGLYGSGMGKAGPYGSTLTQPSNRGLMLAPPVRQEPPYDVRQAMRDVGDIAGMPERIQKGYSGIKAGLVGSPESSTQVTSGGQTRTEVTPASSGLFGRGGEFNLRESGPARTGREVYEAAQDVGTSLGLAHGGAIRSGLAAGGLPYSQAEGEYVPEDISKPMQPPKLQTASTGPMKDQGMEDVKTAMQMAQLAATFAASDRRLKDNIEPIGKLFDGQKVYRYNLKGDDKTQIGLMAQEVEKRHPDAVGLAPRRGYQEGGRPGAGLTIPDEYRTMVEEAAAARGLPPHVLAAVLRQESNFNPEARGGAGEIGLGQIKPSTARDPGFGLSPVSEEDLRDPRRNIDFAASYIAARNPNVDWSNPVAAARALHTNYNAGGDPNYAANVIRYFPDVTEAQLAEVRARAPQERPAAAAEDLARLATQPRQQRGLVKMERSEPDWMQRNQQYFVPVLAGLAGMAASPSRYLGSAILQGLGTAAETYGGMQARFEEQQRAREQTGIQAQQATTAERRVDVDAATRGLELLRFMQSRFTPFTRANPQTGTMETLYRDQVTGRILNAEDYQREIAGYSERALSLLSSGQGSAQQPAATTAAPGAPAGQPSAPGATQQSSGAAPQPAAAGAPAGVERGAARTELPAEVPQNIQQQAANINVDWSNIQDSFNPNVLMARRNRAYQTRQYGQDQGLLRVGDENWNTLTTEIKNYDEEIKNIVSGATPMLRRDGTLDNTYVDLNAERAAAAAGRRSYEETVATGQASVTVTPEGARVLPAPIPGGYTPTTRLLGPAEGGQPAGAAPRREGEAQGQQPRARAELPRNSAEVRTAIPAAPPGGGYPVTSIRPGERQVGLSRPAEQQAKADDDYFESAGRLPSADNLIARYMAMGDALKLFESGAITDTKQFWARYATALGLPDLATGILQGTPSAVQWLEKNTVQGVLEDLATMKPNFAQREFSATLSQGTPSPTNEPASNFAMITEGMGRVMRMRAWQTDWEEAKNAGWQSPSAFFETWSRANPVSTFKDAASRMLGNVRGTSLPSAENLVPGQNYVMPSNADERTRRLFPGIESGQVFRFNGFGQPLNAVRPEDMILRRTP